MKKLFSLLSILLSFTLIFASCGQKKPQELTKIRLNEVVRSIFYAPMYVAINKGFFEEEGLEIELSTGQGADKTMQQVLSGNADIGFCGPEQVIYLYNQGREDYAILFAQLTKRDGSFLVGRQKEEDFKWENLKGKTIIGGRPGGVPEMTLEYVIRNHGLTPHKEVNIITNIAFTATAQAFKSGTGDYVALFEPTASMLQKEGGGYIVASIGKASGEIPYTCFFATKSYMEKNPEIIQKFTNAIYKGQIWVQKHTSKEIAEAVISFFPGSDLDLLTTVVERYKAQDTWSKDPILKEEALSRLMDIIQSYNRELIPMRPSYEKIVTTEFAEKALENIK
ncbi:ABC transporter substrate-binding protein [Caloramator australicus]|uniref:ABC transporter substrate-binding protein n=1 Tax=Caloramator australicus RC3 TaxID=857293 RepID=G0V4R3_9CLOT|nr:ABC transporter substrate-binding protein [Caloramator australicus]CCC58103.1 ABC transporter substrate-binding protein [Caloramator australicus RC3]